MYYPKSQIKLNLYTNGGEYSLSTTLEEYKGYYYEISSGEKYSGRSPQDSPNILLSPLLIPYYIPDIPDSELTYITLEYGGTKDSSINRYIPQFTPTLPTDQDKQNGQFTRYFCKKTNELRYIEIDKNTYNKLQTRDKQIAWDLYAPTIVLWQIKGNQEQVYSSNKGTVISIEQNLNWGGFSQYFQDNFLKYYLGS
jgi:hypothetical protein